MKINLHYNQFSSGGAIDRENWSLMSDEEIQLSPYIQCNTLKTVEVEIPDTWKIDKERDMIFNESGESCFYQELSKDNHNKIKVSTNEFPYYKTIWKE